MERVPVPEAGVATQVLGAGPGRDALGTSRDALGTSRAPRARLLQAPLQPTWESSQNKEIQQKGPQASALFPSGKARGEGAQHPGGAGAGAASGRSREYMWLVESCTRV